MVPSLTGLSERVERNFNGLGKSRDVEREVGHVGETIPRAAVLHQSLDPREEHQQRV